MYEKWETCARILLESAANSQEETQSAKARFRQKIAMTGSKKEVFRETVFRLKKSGFACKEWPKVEGGGISQENHVRPTFPSLLTLSGAFGPPVGSNAVAAAACEVDTLSGVATIVTPGDAASDTTRGRTLLPANAACPVAVGMLGSTNE